MLYSISVGRVTTDGIQGVFRDLLLRTVNRRGAALFTLRTCAKPAIRAALPPVEP